MNTHPVLLVEDDDNDALFLRSAWKKADIANPLHIVTDGQQAVDYLSGADKFADRIVHPLPGLMLLDLNLPCKTGFEVLRWVREHPDRRTLPVVVLTSSAADADAHRAYLLGANSYVVKPSNPEKLREFVAALKLYWMGWNFAAPNMAGGGRL